MLDASVTIAWLLPDESSGYADTVISSTAHSEAFAPAIWPFEVANALLVAERRSRITAADVTRLVQLAREVPVRIDEAGLDAALGPVLALGRAHRLSSYDAGYLELALRLGIPLASIDTRLYEVARALGIAIVGD